MLEVMLVHKRCVRRMYVVAVELVGARVARRVDPPMWVRRAQRLLVGRPARRALTHLVTRLPDARGAGRPTAAQEESCRMLDRSIRGMRSARR